MKCQWEIHYTQLLLLTHNDKVNKVVNKLLSNFNFYNNYEIKQLNRLQHITVNSLLMK